MTTMSEALEFHNVTVLGAGTMGTGIAQVCAQAGARVVLNDVQQPFVERGLQSIRDFLDKGVAKGKVQDAERRATLGRLTTELDVAKAVRLADLVIEAAPEDLALKRSLFAKVAQACRADTVLATNTSSLSLAAMFGGLPGQGRCVGMHFFNPPPIMPLLELVRPAAADPQVMARVERFARQIQKEPIVVRDSPGFATSRLGVCLGLEAIRMVEEGVAEPADIDKAMELGYRHPMGPLRLTDLVGLDVRMAIADYLRGALRSPAFEVPELMRRMVAEGRLGKKSGRGFYDWPA
jgi:3-hydroxybutyryl-CoA dehydrogenase